MFQLLAHARVAQDSGKIEKTNPELKGHTLPQSAVEPPQSFVNTNDSYELMIGKLVFGFMYSVNFLISLSLSLTLLPGFLKVYENTVQEGDFFDDPGRVQWFTAALLALAYIIAVIAAEIFQLVNLSKNCNLDIFIVLKCVFSVILSPFVIGLLIYLYCTKETHAKFDTAIAKKLILVGVVWLAIYLLALSIVPTVLLLCAYPMDTFALIVIHVALVYFEIKVGMLVFMQLSMSKCMSCCRQLSRALDKCPRHRDSHEFLLSEETSDNSSLQADVEPSGADSQTNQPRGNNKATSDAHGLQGGRCCSCMCLVCRVITGFVMFIGLVGIYFAFIWFYQFILLRSVNSNVALDIILKYIPSAVIGLFGFFINKGISYEHQEKDGSDSSSANNCEDKR